MAQSTVLLVVDHLAKEVYCSCMEMANMVDLLADEETSKVFSICVVEPLRDARYLIDPTRKPEPRVLFIAYVVKDYKLS